MFELSGIIREDMTFNAGDVVSLTGRVQLAEGYTLTWKAGSSLDGNFNAIEVFGSLEFEGNSNNLIPINNTYIEGESDEGTIRLDHTDMRGGALFPTFGDSGTLSVTNSVVSDTSTSYSTSVLESSVIENNIFVNVILDANQIDSPVILGNTFISGSRIVTTAWSSGGLWNGTISMSNNNFLVDGHALVLSSLFDYKHQVLLSGNYWGSSDLEEISLKIIDGNDDLNIDGVVDLSSISNSLTSAPMALGQYLVVAEPGGYALTESNNTVLYGGAGIDYIHGKEGNDYLDGGKGNDHLFGGKGNDIY